MNKQLFQVYDRHTDKPVGKPLATMSAAIARVDRLDNKYGGYRYFWRRLVQDVASAPQ